MYSSFIVVDVEIWFNRVRESDSIQEISRDPTVHVNVLDLVSNTVVPMEFRLEETFVIVFGKLITTETSKTCSKLEFREISNCPEIFEIILGFPLSLTGNLSVLEVTGILMLLQKIQIIH